MTISIALELPNFFPVVEMRWFLVYFIHREWVKLTGKCPQLFSGLLKTKCLRDTDSGVLFADTLMMRNVKLTFETILNINMTKF